MIWPQIAIAVVSAVLSFALQQRSQQDPPPELAEDVEIPTPENGKPIPVLFGRKKIKNPNVVNYNNITATPIKKKGGKK